jgi:hypothetical protein
MSCDKREFYFEKHFIRKFTFLENQMAIFTRAWGLVALDWRFILQIAGPIKYNSGKHYEKSKF